MARSPLPDTNPLRTYVNALSAVEGILTPLDAGTQAKVLAFITDNYPIPDPSPPPFHHQPAASGSNGSPAPGTGSGGGMVLSGGPARPGATR